MTAPATRHHAAIEAWFAKHFHGMTARLDEPLYNHIHAAKEDLKQVVADLIDQL